MSNRRYYPKSIHAPVYAHKKIPSGKTHIPLNYNLHQEMIYFTRQYKSKLEEYENLLDSSIKGISYDGLPKGTDISKPTETIAMRRSKIEEDIIAIEDALFAIPEYYRDGVLNHILYEKKWPDGAEKRTWTTYQGRFLYALAENLGKIPVDF